MDAGALAAVPVVVAGVLLVSGLLKFGDRQNTADSMVALRVPFARRLAWFAAWQPWVELVLGLALLVLPGGGFLAAGWVVTVFFGVLTVVVARAALRPEEVHCNCFGAYSTEPVGGLTVLRNAVLAAAALLVALGLAGPSGPVLSFVGFGPQSRTWLVVITVGVLAFGLLWFRNRSLARQVGAWVPDVAANAGAGTPSAAAAGAPSAAAAPAAAPPVDLADEELVTGSGEVLRMREIAAGHAVLLLFLQLECHGCSLVVAELPEWTASLEPAVRVRVATSARPAELAGAHPEVAAGALYGARGIRTALGIAMLPAAVLVGRDLAVAAGPVLGHDEIGALVGGIETALKL